MNDQKPNSPDVLLGYQSQRLQDLIEEILHCCKERTSHLSKKFDIPEAESAAKSGPHICRKNSIFPKQNCGV
jgi:hypothetical protein